MHKRNQRHTNIFGATVVNVCMYKYTVYGFAAAALCVWEDPDLHVQETEEQLRGLLHHDEQTLACTHTQERSLFLYTYRNTYNNSNQIGPVTPDHTVSLPGLGKVPPPPPPEGPLCSPLLLPLRIIGGVPPEPGGLRIPLPGDRELGRVVPPNSFSEGCCGRGCSSPKSNTK